MQWRSEHPDPGTTAKPRTGLGRLPSAHGNGATFNPWGGSLVATRGRSAGEHPHATGTSFSAETRPTLHLARLFIILASTHLFLDSAPLDELPEATHRLLNRLAVPDNQSDHCVSLSRVQTIELAQKSHRWPRSLADPPRHCPAVQDPDAQHPAADRTRCARRTRQAARRSRNLRVHLIRPPRLSLMIGRPRADPRPRPVGLTDPPRPAHPARRAGTPPTRRPHARPGR